MALEVEKSTASYPRILDFFLVDFRIPLGLNYVFWMSITAMIWLQAQCPNFAVSIVCVFRGSHAVAAVNFLESSNQLEQKRRENGNVPMSDKFHLRVVVSLKELWMVLFLSVLREEARCDSWTNLQSTRIGSSSARPTDSSNPTLQFRTF